MPADAAGTPESFVWSKMGAEAGQVLAAIIRRKEYERQLGNGVFAWGIGNALGTAVAELANTLGGRDPVVIFSPMLSKAKADDSAPRSVVIWTGYEDARGIWHQLPPHLVITSRGHAGGMEKTRHYALFCRSSLSLESMPGIGGVSPAALRNFTTGTQLGASQVTAVVRRCQETAIPDARVYPVAFRASLTGIRYARLCAPRLLSAEEIERMNAAAASLDAWRQFVGEVRATPVTHISEQQLEIGYAA